jgi:hypothetical protein
MTPLAARLTAQLLAGEPAGDAVAVAERLLAVQAQDPRGARLAVRARTLGSGTSASDVDRALTEDRSLVISWLNRGTLHLVRRQDWPWLHALTTPPLAELARRYLAGHGPASDRDLARWAGLPLRDARAGLDAIAPQLTQRPDGLVDLVGRAPAASLPPPRLLGAFDPLLLGWTSRAEVLGEHADSGIVTSNGVFRPFALVRGRAVATWRLARGAVALAPFGPLAERDAAALKRDAADVARFLGA